MRQGVYMSSPGSVIAYLNSQEIKPSTVFSTSPSSGGNHAVRLPAGLRPGIPLPRPLCCPAQSPIQLGLLFLQLDLQLYRHADLRFELELDLDLDLDRLVFRLDRISSVEPNEGTVYYTLTLTQGDVAPAGVSRSAILINGQTPGPNLEINEGQTLSVNVINNLDGDATLHFHGERWIDLLPWNS